MAKQRILSPNMFIPQMPSVRHPSGGYAMPTEGAVVYGDLPAVQALPIGVQNFVNSRNAAQIRQQEESQRLAQLWRDNELEAADGQLWANQMSEIEQKHVEEGRQMMAEGINPYESENPRAQKYRRDRRNIEGLRAYRGGVEKDYLSIMQEIRKNPDKYDSESVRDIQDWISGGNVQDYYSSGATLPGLQSRFDISEALKGFTAPVDIQTRTENNKKITDTTVNRPAAERAIIGRIASTPGGMRQLERITGGLPVQDVLSSPNTLEENKAMYDALYDGDPQFRAALASQGIASKDDPRYAAVVDIAAQRRVQAKKALNDQMDNWVSMSSSGLKLGRSETADDTDARLKLAYAQLGVSQGNLAQRVREYNDKMSGKKQESDFAKDVSKMNHKAMEDFRVSVEMNGGRITPAQVTMIDGALRQEEPNTFIVTLPQTEKIPQTRTIAGVTRTETIDVPVERKIKLDGSSASERQVSHILNMLKGISTNDKDNTYESPEYDLVPGSLDDL